jgi:tetratricopeptide (TPR) repeat protein
MRCKDFNRLLNEIAFPEPSPALSPEMDSHRASCRRCAEVWQAEQLLRAVVVPPPPPTLLERLCAFVDEIAAGSVVAFPVRRVIVITGLVLAAAAAAATVKLFDVFDRAPDAVAAMPVVTEPELIYVDGPIVIEAVAPDTIAAATEEDRTAFERVADTVDDRIGTAPPDRAVPFDRAAPAAGEARRANAEAVKVAEPTVPEAPVESPSGGAAAIETHLLLADLRSASDTATVDALGEAFLGRMREQYGDASRQFAAAEMLLAEEYRRRGEVVDAETHLVGAIGILDAAGAAGTELIDPVLALGDLYEQAGDHVAALERYGQARDSIRRIAGVLSSGQITMIDRITNAYLAAGEIESAREVQLEARDLVHRTAGANSVEALEANFRYASWIRNHLGANRRIQTEIEQLYVDAVQVIDEHFVDSDPQQAVRLLESLGRHALSGDFPDNRLDQIAFAALHRARDLARDIALDEPLLLALIERHLGDWAVMNGDENQVDIYYGNAFELLGRLPDGDNVRSAWFSDLHVIQEAPIESKAASDDPAAPSGYVEVAFTLDIMGDATDIEILSSHPAGLMDDAARVAVADSRYRPRLTADGRLTESSASYFMHFQYDPAASAAR